MKKRSLQTLALLALCSGALCTPVPAQTRFDFEQCNWTRLGVYDSWEASPFRTGALAGNVGITDNPFAQELDPATQSPVNPSPKVLAVQRSRYGSNTFGVRIDLAQPLALTPEPQYARLLIHKPVKGRVMLIGLGRRADWPDQSPQAEQFWAMTPTPVEGGLWAEALVSFRGSAGVEIHSLVVVPHLESPHLLQEDFVAYIDGLEITPYEPELQIKTPATQRSLQSRPEFVTVTNANRNGEVLTAQGQKLAALRVPYGQDLTLRMHPEKGFEYKGIIVKHGQNLGGPRIVGGQVQWETVYISRSRFDEATATYTLPGTYLDGDVEIEGLFIELGTYRPTGR